MNKSDERESSNSEKSGDDHIERRSFDTYDVELATKRAVDLPPTDLERRSYAYVDRSALTPYPSAAFNSETGGLNRAATNVFPNDRARYTHAFLAQVQTESYYREHALPQLANAFPLLRERDDFTDLQIDVTLAPLLTVSVAEALAIYPRARNVLDRQRSELDELTARSKLLVNNLESLFAWSFRFRRDGMTLIALSDEYDQRRDTINGQAYSIRSKVINDELRDLIDKVKKAEANFNHAKRRHAELFRREVAERKRAIDLLTNYLSGTLFRVGANLNQINPRYDVSVRGTPFESRIAQLIPLYRRLRAQLIQHRLLRPLVDQIVQYVRSSPDLNQDNFLLRKYF